MKNIILSSFMIAALAGCSAEYQEKVRQENLASDTKSCQSFGAVKGSNSFIQCMATLQAARQTPPAVVMQDFPEQPVVNTVVVPR